jgi:hypothetical protein
MMQLPEICAGGYLHELSKTGDIDGVPMPQERRRANNYNDSGNHEAQLEMLDSAPKGAVYTLTFHEEWDSRGELVQHAEKITWIKVADGEWEPCNTD